MLYMKDRAHSAAILICSESNENLVSKCEYFLSYRRGSRVNKIQFHTAEVISDTV